MTLGTLFAKATIAQKLYLLLIVLLVFSYQPLLQLGVVAGVHIDISLLYIVAILAFAGSLPLIWKNRVTIWSLVPLRVLFIFNTFITLSIAWSANPLRGVITAGFSWLLFGLVCGAFSHALYTRRNKKDIIKALHIVGGIACVFALWQLFADALGVPAIFTLLPEMYQSQVFGFARPTAFALEPQFFGSLLIAPWCYVLYRLLRPSHANQTQHVIIFLFVLYTTVLVLTLSRGALLVSALSAIVLFVTAPKNLARYAAVFLLTALATMIALLLIFASAQINTRDTVSGTDAAKRVVNQLSLGLIDIKGATTTSNKIPADTMQSDNISAKIDGSSYSRLQMSAEALDLWQQSPQTQLYGVGIGGFGKAIQQKDHLTISGSIAGNNYIEILAETGIIGLSIFVTFLVSLVSLILIQRQWLMLAICIAYISQWLFFSGNANVVHVWIFFGASIGYLALHTKAKQRIQTS